MTILPFRHSTVFVPLLVLAVALPCLAQMPADWKKDDAKIRLSGSRQIRAIYHPADKAPRMARDANEAPSHSRRFIYPLKQQSLSAMAQVGPVFINVIDSPPIDGFVPYIAVGVTNARNDELDWYGYAESGVVGSFLTSSPESDYVVGLFDTGASASLLGFADATTAGIYASGLVTSNPVTLSGATGTVTALASYPLGVFFDGLGAIEPNGFLRNPAAMRGESNVSIVVGDVLVPGASDLPTAIGAPMAVFHSTVFDNEHKITRIRGGNQYNGPAISVYEPGDPAIPDYNDSSIPLELRPTGASLVSYFGDLGSLDFTPVAPSIIGDFFLVPQALFFVSSVDLADAGHTAIDRTKFMLDTGAQVTVVGSAVGARLALDPAHPDFQVEIQDVTGQITIKPGFYLDSLEIPAIGDWLSATHVPVVMMDIQSPEGGYLDGIIGMNLFSGFNMVLRGGAFAGLPALDFKLITKLGDIAPAGGDGKVNMLDLATLCAAWLSKPGDANWNAAADIAPADGDAIVNFRDFAVVAADWGWVRGQ
jgi:predicted aspartyl protease